MPEIEIPLGGVSDELAFDRQKSGTTDAAQNVQGFDELERRPMLSRVPGQTKHTSAVLTADTKVAMICDLVYDAPNVAYASLGDSVTVDWQGPVPGQTACANVVHDALGCQYALDGNSGFVKKTADGTQIVKVAVPTLERSALLRAITVDDDGRVILGVSGGGDPNKAAIFCYVPIEDRKYKLLWQIPDADIADKDPDDVGWFTEALVVDGTSLYAAQNDTLNKKSRIAVYTDLGVPNPTRIRTWSTGAYPINDVDRSPVDGSLAITHEPDTARGTDPHTPEASMPLDDAKLEDIVTNYASRARCWHSSQDVDGDDSNNANRDYTATVDRIIDKTGNGRHFYAGALTGDIGGVLRKRGVAGRDALFFNGTNTSYISAAGVSLEFADRHLNKSVLPCHKKHQFAYFVAVRASMSSTLRALVCRAPLPATGAYDNEQVLTLNSTFNGSATVAAAGNVSMYEESASGSGASGRASGSNATPLQGAFGSDGLVLITYVFDNGYDDVVSVPTRSQIRVNGRPVDRWTSLGGFATLVATTLGIDRYPNGTSVVGAGAHFLGDFLEFFCIEDSYDVGFGQSSPYAQRRLIESPVYPDGLWSSGSDTEIERIEAFFAHRCGMAHKLPTGNAALLDALAAGSVNDTISVAGATYTLKAAPTTGAYEVKIGASAFATLVNLHHAINGTGTPGTDYGSATPPHTVVFSSGVLENGNTAGRPTLMVQVRDPRGYVTFATSSSVPSAIAFTGANWTNASHQITHATAFLTYSWVTGDTVTLTGGTSVVNGTYDLAAGGGGSITTVAGGAGDINGATGNISDNSVAGSVTLVSRFQWLNGSTSVTSRNGSGRNAGIYPHPYHYFHAAAAAGGVLSVGGPPRSGGASVESPYQGLTSPHGILAVWDPQTGRLKRCITTGGPSTRGLPWGGVGYGVRWNSAGDLYTVGPRQAIDTNLSTIADNVDWRKFVLLASGFVTTDGATAVLNWQAAPGAQTYHWPRMAVDKWDNCYLPSSVSGTSMLVAKRIAPNTTPGSAIISTVTNLTSDPVGQAVSVDPNYPSLLDTFTNPRAERVVLATALLSTSATDVLYCVRLLSATAARTPTKTSIRLAACGPKLFSVAKSAVPTEISASAFATAPLFIDACTIAKGTDDPNVVAVFVDGETIRIFDPKASAPLSRLRARYGGEIPKRPKLCARYKNRLFFGRSTDWPTRIFGSVAGDIYGWDFDPKGEDSLAVAAYRSDLTSTGDHADNVTALAPIHDDVMAVGGERSLALLVGDPMMGGQFDVVWQGSGVAFGRAHCLTPDKTLWFITNEAELAALPFGEKTPRIVSRKIAKRLSDALDFSKFRPELAWDPHARCIRICLMPVGAGNDLRTDWLYFPDTGAFWPRTYGALGVQPTAMCVVDGQTNATRVVLLGSRDGYVREIDPSATDDDGTIIDAYCDLVNFAPQGAEREALFSGFTFVLANAQGGARFEAHVLDNPDDDPGSPVDLGELFPGYNTPSLRFSGQNCRVRIASSPLHERFALIRATAHAQERGMARARSM